jgi:EXPERA (EXPanded EBP superfamily)
MTTQHAVPAVTTYTTTTTPHPQQQQGQKQEQEQQHHHPPNQKDDLGWCHYIAWDSDFLRHTFPDPTRSFVVVCISIMYIRYVLAHNGNLLLGIYGLFLNPYVLFYVGTAMCTVYMGTVQYQKHNHKAFSIQKLPLYERWIIEWYFWNGCMFHAIMDGSSGSLRLVPVVVHQYDVLDLRFVAVHCVPFMIGMVELLIMYPLCLLSMYTIIVDVRHSYRFPLELITSTLHIFGAILFVFTEVYDGQCHIPALDPVGQHCDDDWTRHTIQLKFNWYHLTYYWFGFWFCNMIWVVVPLYRIIRSVMECQRALQQTHPSNTTSHTTNGGTSKKVA